MPLYASAFFLPTSQSVPYLLEDVYLRGGFRTVATIEARNAIRAPARKQGMMVFVQEDKTLYHIPDSTSGAAAWEKWDATKYVNFQYDEPLSLEEDEETGERTLTIDKQRIVPVISEEEADYVLIATEDGPVWAKKLFIPDADKASAGDAVVLGPDGKVVWGRSSGLPSAEGAEAGDTVVLDENGVPVWGRSSGLPSSDGYEEGTALVLDANGQPIWGKVSGLPETEGAQANNVLALDDQLQPVWRHLEGLPSYEEAEAGSVLGLNAEKQPDWLTQDKLRSTRVTEDIELGVIAPGGSAFIPVPITCATATLLRVALSHPMLLLEIHGRPDYSDSNPYAFRSSVALLEDDGTTVLEDSTVVRSRRYAIFSCPDVNDKTMYIKVTNEGPSTSVPTLSLTYLPAEQ